MSTAGTLPWSLGPAAGLGSSPSCGRRDVARVRAWQRRGVTAPCARLGLTINRPEL